MIKVSIIIPVFNVQKLIHRCAKSLFEQSLDDVEFIFVDDCSPDDSISVVKQLLLDYPHRASHTIFCRHDVNKGLPSARKTGMAHAHGEYIAHCDSDDWVDISMYEELYNAAVEGQYDIVSCDFYKSDGVNHKKIIAKHNSERLIYGPVWNKLVRRELYSGIIFPKENKAEDGVIMLQLSYFARKTKHISTPYYYYYVNPDSICHVPTKQACLERWRQEVCNVKIRVDFLRKENVLEKYSKDVVMMKYYANSNLIPYLSDDDIYSVWKKSYPELAQQLKLTSNFPLRVRIAYFLTKHRLVSLLTSLKH